MVETATGVCLSRTYDTEIWTSSKPTVLGFNLITPKSRSPLTGMVTSIVSSI